MVPVQQPASLSALWISGGMSQLGCGSSGGGVSLERQERDAQSGDEKGGGVLLVSRRTSQDAYARRQHSQFYVTRCAARSCSLDCEDVLLLFFAPPCKLEHMRSTPTECWAASPRPRVPARSGALRLFGQTYPFILIFNESRKSAWRRPLAEHVTSPDNLYACNCIRRPRNAPFRCLHFNPC